jgi:hypothetical protein
MATLSQAGGTDGPICQANHATPEPALNIRPVTRNRGGGQLWTGRLI